MAEAVADMPAWSPSPPSAASFAIGPSGTVEAAVVQPTVTKRATAPAVTQAPAHDEAAVVQPTVTKRATAPAVTQAPAHDEAAVAEPAVAKRATAPAVTQAPVHDEAAVAQPAVTKTATAPAVTQAPVHEETVDGNGDEAVHTLLWTAATERPVPEVAALVARLKDSATVSNPADVALRAAAVSRPLDEVRQLVVLLNEAGYDLHQAKTTLRAAAVGRPIEDIVELVNIIGTDSSSWQTLGGTDAEPHPDEPGQGVDTSPRPPAPAAEPAPKGIRRVLKRAKAPSDSPPIAGPVARASSSALRSGLRWPAAIALLASGLFHLPTDVAGLQSVGGPAMVSAVITALCLVCGTWMAVQDSVRCWAAAAAVAAVVIGVHALAGARTGSLLNGSLGSRLIWAPTLTVLTSAAVITLATVVLLRHTKATGTADRA